MQIAPAARKPAASTPPADTPAPTAPEQPHTESPWRNPAAAAALRSSTELLRDIETGITKNYQDAEKVRGFAVDLHSTNDILTSAADVLANDAFAENDQFLPLISRASSGVSSAEVRLSSKDIASTWPFERSDILAAVRQARVLSDNVARSLSE